MGYLIVGQKIDAHDWQQVPGGRQIPEQEIIDNIMRQAEDGNIVLFHDGGGERDQHRQGAAEDHRRVAHAGL